MDNALHGPGTQVSRGADKNLFFKALKEKKKTNYFLVITKRGTSVGSEK